MATTIYVRHKPEYGWFVRATMWLGISPMEEGLSLPAKPA
jgi:hypothetical protein